MNRFSNSETEICQIVKGNQDFEILTENDDAILNQDYVSVLGFKFGKIVKKIKPPHPVYTDGFGTPVTQLNMVVLGGINGLNS
jgi:hypothetical protein